MKYWLKKLVLRHDDNALFFYMPDRSGEEKRVFKKKLSNDLSVVREALKAYDGST